MGNGGIFGLYATVSIDYPTGIQVFVHEFGHHFADLGDEYYFNAEFAYTPANTRVEPWEPNITALVDPHHVKWQSLVKSGTPIPTPWPKDCYENSLRDSQKLIEKLRAENRPASEITEARRTARETAQGCLSSGPYADKVGAFEGAMYETKGILPAAAAMHHDFRRSVLRGMPPCDRRDHRSLLKALEKILKKSSSLQRFVRT